jgi:chromate reductase
MKNAIDWASRPHGDNAWEGKPVAIMGASGGAFGTVRAQYHLRQILVTLDMKAINRPEVLIANSAEKFDAQGNLTDEKTRGFINKLLEALVAWTRQLDKGKR